jgi:predicted ATPase
MKLVVKNYGAIKEGTIDLSKKLYLFVGYNNTGKTYLTKLIYEIFNPDTLNDFSNSSYNVSYNEFNYEAAGKLTLTKKLIDAILEDYSSYLQEVVIQKFLKVGTDSSFIYKTIHIAFEYTLEDVKKHELKSGAKIGFAQSKTEIEVYNLTKAENSLEISFEHLKMEDIFSKLPSNFFDDIPKKRFEEQINSIKNDVSKTVVVSLLNLLLQNEERSFFLPSNRISILENAEELKRQEDRRKKELSELIFELLENKSNKQDLISNLLAKKSESEHPTYINNLINEVLKLRSSKDDEFVIKGTGFYDALLPKLIAILGGEIIYEKTAAFSSRVEKFKINQENANLMRMDLASSSVNQLSTLFLFLKYWAKPERNFLMIDEPEENLHPQNQILLINLLLEFFLTNNRLLITTHSPLVAEVVNNYLILGQLENKEKLIEELELPNIDISPTNTGIYYFQGETVVEHRIENYGTIFTSYKFVQDRVYGLGEHLSDLMFSQLNKSVENVSNKRY